MSVSSLPPAPVKGSVAGEEDPGASLDVVRAIMAHGLRHSAHAAARPEAKHQTPIHMDCAMGGEVIGVDVEWQSSTGHSAAELLGLIVAHHGTIAKAAWSRFGRTGQRHVAVEVDEDSDGVFYVSLKDA